MPRGGEWGKPKRQQELMPGPRPPSSTPQPMIVDAKEECSTPLALRVLIEFLPKRIVTRKV